VAFTDFKINGVRIKTPSSFDMSYYTLTKSNRVANGDMVMEYVANKRKFNFNYDAITSTELNKIIEELWNKLNTTRQCFHTFEYMDDNVRKTVVVYAGSIPKKLHRADGQIWVWKNVKFSLIER
jgi:hypothetical protein